MRDAVIIVVGLALLALVWSGWQSYKQLKGNSVGHEESIACTMEAKECPDGSYVGRVGPNCEFAPCP